MQKKTSRSRQLVADLEEKGKKACLAWWTKKANQDNNQANDTMFVSFYLLCLVDVEGLVLILLMVRVCVVHPFRALGQAGVVVAKTTAGRHPTRLLVSQRFRHGPQAIIFCSKVFIKTSVFIIDFQGTSSIKSKPLCLSGTYRVLPYA